MYCLEDFVIEIKFSNTNVSYWLNRVPVLISTESHWLRFASYHFLLLSESFEFPLTLQYRSMLSSSFGSICHTFGLRKYFRKVIQFLEFVPIINLIFYKKFSDFIIEAWKHCRSTRLISKCIIPGKESWCCTLHIAGIRES